MTKLSFITLSVFILLNVACEKSENFTSEIVSDDAMELRSELQDKGYTETIVDSIFKQECFFKEWNKTVLTPVSGLLEFHDMNNNWVASIDFGNGNCDQWAIKTWNVNVFPENSEGESQFSVFKFNKNKK